MCSGEQACSIKQLTPLINQGATNSVFQITFQRMLLRLGSQSRRLVHAPILAAVPRQRRLEFACQYRNWTSIEWRQVKASNESRLMVHQTDGRWRIRRETSESKHPAAIARTDQARDRSIMIWEMFLWHSLGSYVIVKDTLDKLQVRIYPCGPYPPLYEQCFSSG
ncbi:transposable element Tcb1 transposase [Trichonephila clavipes]|nr:transposable element Tcb1 transposase [Trichonephila clavipes]